MVRPFLVVFCTASPVNTGRVEYVIKQANCSLYFINFLLKFCHPLRRALLLSQSRNRPITQFLQKRSAFLRELDEVVEEVACGRALPDVYAWRAKPALDFEQGHGNVLRVVLVEHPELA